MKFIIIFFMLISTVLGAFGALYLKKGSKKFDLKKALFNTNLFFGVFLYGVSTLAYLYALSFDSLSTIYPMTSLTYIWVIILSYFYLKEEITKKKVLSISLIILGIILVLI